MKLIFVTYYGFKDSLLGAKEALERIGYDVVDYPLFRFSSDVHDKIDNYVHHFSEFIEAENPDVILWWCLQLSDVDLEKIHKKTQHILHILYSWDDPFVWECSNHSKIDKKAKYFDIAFISCEESVKLYLEHGTKEAYCLYPGFDREVNHKIDNMEYEYDVTIGVTNLYEDLGVFKNQYIKRKELIEELTKCKDIKFGIYGPEYIKTKFPDNYISFINYSQLNTMINKSKINISTHVTNKLGYLNERCFLIMGSGGLLFVDPIIGTQEILKDGYNCITINKHNYINQIKDILKNYNDYSKVKSNALEFSNNFTWDKWAIFIDNKLVKNNKIQKKQLENKNNISLLKDIQFMEWTEYNKVNCILNEINRNPSLEAFQKLQSVINKNPYVKIYDLIDRFLELKNR